MEDVLDVYERPYTPKRPVVGFDEKPFLLTKRHVASRSRCQLMCWLLSRIGLEGFNEAIGILNERGVGGIDDTQSEFLLAMDNLLRQLRIPKSENSMLGRQARGFI
jgi:hypothetical protein